MMCIDVTPGKVALRAGGHIQQQDIADALRIFPSPPGTIMGAARINHRPAPATADIYMQVAVSRTNQARGAPVNIEFIGSASFTGTDSIRDHQGSHRMKTPSFMSGTKLTRGVPPILIKQTASFGRVE